MAIFAAITAFFTYVGNAAVTYFAGFSIQSVITNLIISWALDELLAQEFEDRHKGTLLNKSANNAPIPVIYGFRKVGGVRSFVGTSGADNTYLWVVLTISEGEIHAIDDIYIDDVLLNSSSKHWSNTVVTKYTGTDSQTAHSNLVAANIGWTSNHRLRGLAYVVCRFTWDRDIFSSIPTIHALVRGKKVLDPRNNATAYSANPALCLRDYLTNARYGKGLPAASIDDTLFGAAATKCETQVTPYSGASQQNLFDCSMVLNTDKTLIDNTKELMAGCRGLMPYQGGKFGLIIEDEKTGNAVFNFTTDHIIGGITIESEKKSTKYNRAIMTFANPDKNWQTDTIDWPAIGSSAHNAYLSEDNNVGLVGRLSLPSITNVYTAIDIAELVVKRSRAGLKVVMECTSEALKCQVGDIVTITHPTPGWSAKEFRVMLTSLMPSGTVTLNLVEHQDNIYPWGTKTQAASSPSTNLPDPFVVAAPTNLAVNVGSSHYLVQTDGAIIVRSQVTFTASVDKFVERYIVQWKYAGDSVYANDIILTGTVGYISGFKTGETIDVRVKSVSTVGVSSAYLIVTGTSVTANATAPGVPGSLTATARQGAIELSWTNPSNTDFAYVEINRHTANSLANSSLFLKTSNTTVVDQVGEAVTRYYFARAFNRSGVASAWSSVASATSLRYPVAAAPDPTLAHTGLVYYATNQASAPATPSASSYSFATGAMTSLTSSWSITPPVLDISQAGKYWSSRWAVEETTSGGGTGTPTFQTAIAQFTFDGVVTFTNNTTVTDGTNTINATSFDVAGAAAAAQAAAITAAATASNAQAALDLITSAAYADGIVTAEETRAIADATTKANAAQAAAEAASDSAGSAAAAQSAAISSAASDATNKANAAQAAATAAAQTKATLAQVTASAYADGIVTAEETRAIADATAKANAAQAAAESASDVAGAAAAAQAAAISSAASDATNKANAAQAAAISTAASNSTAATLLTLQNTVYAAGTTEIDGGNIKTGTVTAQYVVAQVALSSPVITGGNIRIGSGSTTNGYAFELLPLGGLEASFMSANQLHAQNYDFPVLSAIFGESVPNSSNVAVLGKISSNTSSTSAHAVRGTNSYTRGSRVQTSGLIGAANGYDFYAEGAGTNYGPFTGAHDCLVANDETVSIGDLVVDVSCIARRGLSNTLFSVETSNSANQAAVLGVIVANNGFLSDRAPAAFIDDITEDGVVMTDDYETVKNNYQLMAVNAVGEGQINIVGEGGNLSAGDLIVASSTAGKGMKQADDFVRSYTVARARESVSFDSPGEVKMVACIYLCG